MKVTVNGRPHELADRATVRDAVSCVVEGAVHARGLAAAVNGEVVPRSRWDDVRLDESDRVEVLRAVGGG